MEQNESNVMRRKNEKLYTIGEEIFNSISHGIGAGLSIAALVISVVAAVLNGGIIEVVSACIYGSTLIIMYLFSTLYHAIQNEKAKKVLRVFDHSSIFLLIAGTYTPYTLVTLRHSKWGIILFCTIWSAALIGILLNSINMRKFRVVSHFLYVAMGWAVIFAIKPLIESLVLPGLVLLVAGGIVYTAGIIFYSMKKFKFMHSIWHLFVLGGSILHFLSIVIYVY